jgi:hypothetical protein
MLYLYVHVYVQVYHLGRTMVPHGTYTNTAQHGCVRTNGTHVYVMPYEYTCTYVRTYVRTYTCTYHGTVHVSVRTMIHGVPWYVHCCGDSRVDLAVV